MMPFGLNQERVLEVEIKRLRAECDAYRVRHESYYALERRVMELRAALEQLVKDVEDGEPHDVGLDMAREALANENS